MNVKRKIAAVSLGAVALGALVGAGVSYADDPTTSRSASSPSTTGPSAQRPKQGEHAKRALLRRTLHGEVTVGGAKKTRVIDVQRGTAEKVSASSITVRSVDGFSATYVVSGDTLVRKDGSPAKIADIASGDKVRVVAWKSGSTSTAKVIAEPKKR